MKSPQQLAQQLARQWLRADWRERQLLDASAWPVAVSVGQPSVQTFRHDGTGLQEHLQTWRAVSAAGPGTVTWRDRQYRDGASPVALPSMWTFHQPSELMAAIEQHGLVEHRVLVQLHKNLAQILSATDPLFRRLLVRKLALWRHAPVDQVVLACQVAMQLTPGCAQGKPLRAMQLCGCDTKFFERHQGLLTALADERFDGDVSQQGLTAFLDADPEGEHWLLIQDLSEAGMPYPRMRLTAEDLRTRALPGTHVLIVENERCVHQLPRNLPGAVAILGAGRNLGWLAAPWLQRRRVAYWGDLDTWGLVMLGIARNHLPGLSSLLMDADTLAAHADMTVREPVPADVRLLAAHPDLQALAQVLHQRARGRLEQEFLPQDDVRRAIVRWHGLGGDED